jgi:penicillin V acylase-like amidase (Ntn superfamily)
MCSVLTIAFQQTPVLAANYDFYVGHGLLAVSKKGVEKKSFPDQRSGAVFSWVVAYQSVTLNQFGCELPCAGMNEAGLAIHLLQCEDGQYPPPAKGQTIMSELQWIQYVLDRCASIDEVIQTLQSTAFEGAFFTVHFAVVDMHEMAFISPTAQGFSIFRSPAGANALTNRTHDASIRFEKNPSSHLSSDSFDRFCQLYRYAPLFQEGKDDPTNFLFSGLNRVAKKPSRLNSLIQDVSQWMGVQQPYQGATVWQTLFFPKEKTLFLSTLADKKMKFLNLREVFFTETDERVKTWNMDHSWEGNLISQLTTYQPEENTSLVKKVYRFFGEHVSSSDLEFIASYPSHLGQ